MVGSTLIDIIDYIKTGAIRDAEVSALALRDEHLPAMIRGYDPKDQGCDRCPTYVPHRDITLKVSGMVNILVSQLGRKDAEGALDAAKDMLCVWGYAETRPTSSGQDGNLPRDLVSHSRERIPALFALAGAVVAGIRLGP